MHVRLLALACLVGPVRAVDPDGLVWLPPWVVSEVRPAPDAAPLRANAVLPATAWSGRSLATLADAFRGIPGATLLESFGGFEPPRISLRGSGVQSAPSSRGVALRFDGASLGLADGSFNSALLEPALASRVEVQRGPDGWRAAPDTMGGALDLRGEAETWPAVGGTGFRVETGSFGARRASLRTTAAGEADAVTAALAVREQEGFRAQSGQERQAGFVSWCRRIGAATQAAVGLYHGQARYDVPGPLTRAAAAAAPRSVSAEVQRDRPQRESGLLRATAAVSHTTSGWELAGGLAWARTTDDFRQLQANGLAETRSDDASVQLTLMPAARNPARRHHLRLAATAAAGWRTTARRRNDAGERGPEFARDDLRPWTGTFLLEDTVALAPRVTGTIGVAQLVARRDVRDRLGGGMTYRFAAQRTLPQAGLRWRVARDVVVFGGVTATAEPPTYDDLVAVTGPYPALRRTIQPLALQRAVTYEIGGRGHGARFSWDAALYHSDWRHEILRLADANGAARGAVNAAATTRTGVEASGRWRVVEGPVRVSLVAAATWSEGRFDDDPVYGSGRVAGLPPWVSMMEATAEGPRGWFAAAGADTMAGTTYVDHARRLGYGGRTLAHVRLGRHWGGAWTVAVDVRNLFDRRSIASTAGVLDLARNPAATAIFLPAPGRSVTVVFTWQSPHFR